jgi:hypothetical protein
MVRKSRGGIRSVGIFVVIAISLGITAVLIAGGNGFSVAASPLSVPGDVLIAGGDAGGMLFAAVPKALFVNSTKDAQIFDPTTGSFTAVANLNHDREGAVAVALPNGKVLIAGGASCAASGASGANCAALQTAELYDPVTATFAVAGSGSGNQMVAARFAASATVISGCNCALDGDVLLAGGNGGTFTVTQTGFTFSQVPNDSAELYDPRTDTFTAIAAAMHSKRESHVAAVIPNDAGRVLLAGGDDQGFFQHSIAGAEIFNPTDQSFTATAGPLNSAREIANAIALDPAIVSGPLGGEILISGGLAATANVNGSSLNNAELFDPAGGGTFTDVSGTMGSARTDHSATLFTTGTLAGKVLLAGGVNVAGNGTGLAGVSENSTNTSDIYDPSSGLTGTLSGTTGTMHESRGGHAAALLTIGANANQVIVAGGEHCVAAACVVVSSSSDTTNPAVPAELFDPNSQSWTALTSAMVPPVNAPAGFGVTLLDPPTIASSATPTATAATPTATPTAVPAALVVSPKRIGFPAEVVVANNGAPSRAFKVTVFNPINRSQNQTVQIIGTGISPNDFEIDPASTTCGSSLAAGQKCQYGLIFKPTALGSRTGTFSVTSNSSTAPLHSVALAGIGKQGVLLLKPRGLRFSKQSTNALSTSKPVTVNNVNPVPLALAAAIGGDFTITGTTCPTSPAMLAAKSTCQVMVAFAPTAPGKRFGTLTFTDQAKGTTQQVKLFGLGGSAGPSSSATPTHTPTSSPTTAASPTATATSTLPVPTLPIGTPTPTSSSGATPTATATLPVPTLPIGTPTPTASSGATPSATATLPLPTLPISTPTPTITPAATPTATSTLGLPVPTPTLTIVPTAIPTL